MTDTLKTLREGSELHGRRLTVTMERIQWYGNAMLSAATSTVRTVGSNIHTDEEYAQQQGLPAAVADGMMSTNWLSSMLVDVFGHHYLDRGELRTKYIKPVLVGPIVMRGRVEKILPIDARSKEWLLTVWCEDADGVMRTEGNARVVVVDPE
jgi:3-hydroxybutyryl-CoA dehydratase